MGTSPPIVRVMPDGPYRALFSLALQFAIAADHCRHGEVPVMDLRDNEIGYRDPDHPNPNPWEYYFEQPPIENVVRTDDRSFGYPCFLNPVEREQAHRNLRKFLHVREHILHKVNRFRRRFMDGHSVLGIHVRGTDSYLDNSRPHLPTDFIVGKIRLYMAERGFTRILLCTDQVQTVDRYQRIFGDQLVCYPSRRVDLFSGADRWLPGIHTKDSRIPPYVKGEDVLIEALLLSQGSFLLKTFSNFSHFVVASNIDLDYVDLDYRFFDPAVFKGKGHKGWELPGKPCRLEPPEAEAPYIQQAIEFERRLGKKGRGAKPDDLAAY